MNVIAGLSEMLHSGLDIECDRSTENGLYQARVLFKLGDENWQQMQYPSFACQSENMIEAIKGASRQAYEYLAGQLVPPRVVDEDGPRDPEPRGQVQVQDRNGEKSAVMPFAGQKPKRAAPGSRLFFLSSQLISLLNQYNSGRGPLHIEHFEMIKFSISKTLSSHLPLHLQCTTRASLVTRLPTR